MIYDTMSLLWWRFVWPIAKDGSWTRRHYRFTTVPDWEVVRDGQQKRTYFRDAQTDQTCSLRPPVDQEVGVQTEVEGSWYLEGVAWEMLLETVSELSDSQRARILLAAHVVMEGIRHPCGSFSERS